MTDLLTPPPTPAEVHAARLVAGLSQPAMAELIGLASYRTVQAWESGQNPVTPGSWVLFLLATGQHPGYKLKSRAQPVQSTASSR